MGVIYLAESPSGKAYVGQTARTVAHRWSQHVTEANRRLTRGCRRLNQAILKYGGDSFRFTECWTCSDDELDEWEAFFMELFDTLHPLGYNLVAGGQMARGKYTDDTRKRMSAAKRFNVYGDAELPPGVTYVKDGKNSGFRIRVGANCLRVTSASQTMEEKFTEAMRLHEDARKGTLVVTPGRTKSSPESASLPMYVSYSTRRKSYSVHVPGHPRRSFGACKNPEDAKTRALEYLASIQI